MATSTGENAPETFPAGTAAHVRPSVTSSGAAPVHSGVTRAAIKTAVGVALKAFKAKNNKPPKYPLPKEAKVLSASTELPKIPSIPKPKIPTAKKGL